MPAADLPLRDVHLPPSPPWWPPAPGWWLLAGAVALAVAALLFWRGRRNARLHRWQALFDAACAAGEGTARVAAISALLRRASRRVDGHADALSGEDWLRFLDGGQGTAFSQGAGRLLLDGGFRPEVDGQALAQLQALARARFLELMRGRR
jgi:hypothetical protein